MGAFGLGKMIPALLQEIISLLSASQVTAILQTAMDALLRLSGAERGFVVMRTRNELEVVAARNLGREQVVGPLREFSHTLAKRAIEERRTICLVNASNEPEFRDLESVSRLKLRSVLVVPLRGTSGVLGAVYLDNRRVSGVFGEETARLAEAFASVAAIAVAKALQVQALESAQKELEKQLRRRGDFDEMIGSDPVFLAALDTAAIAARSDLAILIEGETGTGKELLAAAVHKASPRAAKPLLRMNCAAVPEPLLEDELFGHVKGAFTGAHDERSGLFAAANEGTIFLDEVPDMSPAMQSKVLRVLERGELRKVGSDKLERVDVRVIAATAKPLEEEVKAGRFRKDLYYRLKGVKVRLPPLRERKGDIPALVRRFMGECAGQGHEASPSVSPEAMRCLAAYDYPGNVRELESLVRRAVLFTVEGQIVPASLPPEVTEHARTMLADPGVGAAVPRSGEELRKALAAARADAVAKVEKAFLLLALEEAGGNVSLAARRTGVNRTQFQQMLSRHGIRRRGQPRT
jgi:transcriptional regulator with GAF, ATPase, and Fis domain